jgi:hypothetical protein
MRVLLDECVSEGLRNYLTGHDCQTARHAGFAGLENGLDSIKSIQAGQVVRIGGE